jgi:chemotaxis protein MotB
MSKKKQHHEEHVDEAWLLPYSDMLTLLLALFIVMFAMGQTDKQKLQEMSQQFNIIFAGGKGVMQSDGQSAIPMPSNTEIEDAKMSEIKKTLEDEISKEGYSDKVKVDVNSDGLEISIQDTVLFNTGEADVLNNLSPLLLEISKMLHGLDNEIKVVGYTDNVPIKNEKFRSNWELSSMRAINVMNFMVDSGKIQEDKVSIQAYGEYQPKFDNTTEQGRAKNRRVEIIVVRKYPVDTQEKSN